MAQLQVYQLTLMPDKVPYQPKQLSQKAADINSLSSDTLSSVTVILLEKFRM